MWSFDFAHLRDASKKNIELSYKLKEIRRLIQGILYYVA